MNLGDVPRYVPGMAVKELWWYEARRCGTVPLALPMVVAGLLSILVPRSGLGGQWLLGAGFALPVGLCAAAVAAGERMTELQLTVPTALSRTMCRRFVLLLVPVSAGAVLVVVVTADERELLPMMAFVALLAATAAWAAAVLRSLAGASTVVVVTWLATLLLVQRLVTEPLPQAVALLAVAAPVFTMAMHRLADGARLIGPGPE
ncbi:MAG: hypothetical protein ACRDSR_06425 [Pseudonocardiaceae bacterium]